MSAKQTDCIPDLIYFVNFIVRNVIPVSTVGHVHNGRGALRSWLTKNGFNPIFDLSTHQVSKTDLSFISSLTPDAVIAHDPFYGMGVDDIELAMGVLDQAKQAIIAAVPTGEHHQVSPAVVYRVKQWVEILEQLGSVVEIYHCTHYSLFLIVK